MTRDEILNLPTAPEMWEEIRKDKNLWQDAELLNAFEKKKVQEFEEKIIRSIGRFDPNMHYDFNKTTIQLTQPFSEK